MVFRSDQIRPDRVARAEVTHGKVVEKPGYKKACTLYSSKALFQVLMMAGLSAVTWYMSLHCQLT